MLQSGAVYVFGPQKGVKDEEKPIYDGKIKHFAEETVKFTGTDYRMAEGAGAAGGPGFAFLSFLPNVELKSGIDIVLEAIRLEQEVKDADIVITGEGRLDFQTAMGKVPVGVARLAKKYGVKVIAFAGGVTKDAKECNKAGINAFFPIVRGGGGTGRGDGFGKCQRKHDAVCGAGIQADLIHLGLTAKNREEICRGRLPG